MLPNLFQFFVFTYVLSSFLYHHAQNSSLYKFEFLYIFKPLNVSELTDRCFHRFLISILSPTFIIKERSIIKFPAYSTLKDQNKIISKKSCDTV